MNEVNLNGKMQSNYQTIAAHDLHHIFPACSCSFLLFWSAFALCEENIEGFCLLGAVFSPHTSSPFPLDLSVSLFTVLY